MKKSELAERIERLERELAALKGVQERTTAPATLPELGVLKPWRGPYVDHIYRPYPNHFWDRYNPFRVMCGENTVVVR